ncbi:MAG: pyridoxamine 5'-phosphate oxidase [Chloroflexi bacterium]|nr:pyridoxamine 5'-phosphate oxidase [Chloroflexota bacterium]MDA1145539.1 pyridoxamine 5'-phosphate oxidase [Chloroflexota bacterium]
MTAVEWSTFRDSAPTLEAIGRMRLHGRTCYLATSRRGDGAPRVHPVTPDISASRLFVFMEPTSPKGHDLRVDPRFALHCGVEDNAGGEGEFFVSGAAVLTDDPELRTEAVQAGSYAPADRYILFHLLIDHATLRRYEDGTPVHQRWRSDD